MSVVRGTGRGRAFLRFLVALIWVAIAHLLSERAANGFTHGHLYPLIRNCFEIFLFLLGFSYMELSWENVPDPLRAMGLGRFPGALRQFGLGIAIGWGLIAGVLLADALLGHLYVRLWGATQAWGLLLLQIAVLSTEALAAEIAFRGYPFQKLVRATGPYPATVLAAVVFAVLRLHTPGATAPAVWISGIAAVVLSIAYLRTGALWVPWGLHFGWLASTALLFGQPLAGDRRASSVIHTYADGPAWLTGGEFGPEASVVALVLLWVAVYVIVRTVRPAVPEYTETQASPLESSDPRPGLG